MIGWYCSVSINKHLIWLVDIVVNKRLVAHLFEQWASGKFKKKTLSSKIFYSYYNIVQTECPIYWMWCSHCMFYWVWVQNLYSKFYDIQTESVVQNMKETNLKLYQFPSFLFILFFVLHLFVGGCRYFCL